MNSLRAVFVYELRRSLTAGRMLWWLLIAGFPVVITMLMKTNPDFGRGAEPMVVATIWTVLLYALVPSIGCALSVMLMSAPAVASELESRSWVYLATRPRGIFWLLLGKYLVSFVWGASASAVGAIVAVSLTGAKTASQLTVALVALSVLSAMSYSAVYLLIGTLLPKRSMVFCVIYTFIVELCLGFIPAIVNRLTVQFRLRTLLVKWVPVDERLQESSAFTYAFADGSSIVQILWLITLTLLFLVAAQIVAHRKEFTTASEGDL